MSAVAQEAEGVINEIVVSFIRRSTLDAIEIKRSNVGVMEAISAEDLAAFQMATLLSPSPGFLE